MSPVCPLVLRGEQALTRHSELRAKGDPASLSG